MVAETLLTTEEVLASNLYWCILDSVWVTEDLEPFEEINPEHWFDKPLSRDSYYAKHPEITRSESEDETPLTLTGFEHKYYEWRSKINIRKISQRRNSFLSNSCAKSLTSSPSLQESTRRFSYSSSDSSSQISFCDIENNENKIRDFWKRLLESVPPPPIELLHESATDSFYTYSILERPKSECDFDDIDLPDYEKFETDKIINSGVGNVFGSRTSTLKKCKPKYSYLSASKTFKESESQEDWFESIFGVSDLIDQAENSSYENPNKTVLKFELSVEHHSEISNFTIADTSDQYLESWSEKNKTTHESEPVLSCNMQDLEIPNEDILSSSHFLDDKIMDISDGVDEETGYARFAIYKIYGTLKLEGDMKDSSSMKDFNISEDEEDKSQEFTDRPDCDGSYFENVYRLAPIVDLNETVNDLSVIDV